MLTYWSVAGGDGVAGYIGPLANAQEVAVSQSINGDYTLTFSYPRGGDIVPDVLKYVEFEGQYFIVTRVNITEEAYMSVTCQHIFYYYSKKKHLPNIGSTNRGDFIGTPVYSETGTDVSSQITGFRRMTEAEVNALGMAWVTDAIDFESMDKTTAWDGIMRIIECAGRGELYVDNLKWAIVARLGSDTGEILSPGKNLTQYTIERDVTEYINRLYPYGKDDGQINPEAYDKPYIMPVPFGMGEGSIEGYKDYSATTDAQTLFDMALWDMDAYYEGGDVRRYGTSLNPDALDQIAVNVSGKVVDTPLTLGDGLSVVVDGKIFPTRLISYTRHPFDGTPDDISCGHVKKDMYYYLRQVGYFTRQYKKIATGAGAVRGQRIYGGVAVDGAMLTADSSGNLYVNGNKIVTE